MFHMANDSHLFRTQEWLEDAGYILEGNRFALEDDCYLPLYEAKLFHQFDHRFATFADLPRSQIEKGNARELPIFEKAEFDTVVIPRYWVHEQEVVLRTASPSGGSSRREQSAGAVGGSSRAPTALDWLGERAQKSLSGTSQGRRIGGLG